MSLWNFDLNGFFFVKVVRCRYNYFLLNVFIKKRNEIEFILNDCYFYI